MAAKLAPGIREKRKGYFEVRVYGGVDPQTGKTLQLSRTVRGTIRDANALRAAMLLEVDRRGHAAATSRTVPQLFAAVLDHLDALGREPTTLHGYRQIAGRWQDELGAMPLRKLRAGHLDAFYASMLRAGSSAARVRRYHAFMHRCLAQAVKWDWVADNVADRASPPPEPRRQIKVETAEAVTRLIATAEQSRQPELAIAFRLLAALGGRRGEVCGLQWRDVDVDTCVCVLRRAVKHVGPTLVVGDVKNHQERSVLLDAGTLAVLARHRAAMEHRAALCGEALTADAFVLSDALDGSKPWQPNRLTQALVRLRERAGFNGRLHDLRHWHAAQLLTAGEAPVVVAERLGHRDPSTTHRWYSQALPRSDRRAASLIGDALDR
ncbi:MAG: tyrosine-type recombinase/integrase [Acidimicrobiia bacterium]